ncbi:cytochrome ubiquinol oxidase subunit I [Pseudidiomarina gelatinasegens]|uniref:cytochrome ubiquinol oxidase subunit I n=1 Tax=Pseudidiomarina gelatinasegens TaxID=2487740 RepID=UPI0030EE53F9
MFETWFSQADAILLARFQFAFTIAFHIIFPAFTIGLASYLAVLEGLFLKTRNPVYQKLYRYWLKIFAVAFGMGVVSGIVMSYQFGTNWSVFSDKAGPVIGPLMGYEVLTAFFLEAGFLGVMLFGMNKVGERLHYFATLMVAVGTAISAFWILSVNSWMQTPAGFAMNEQGQYVVTSWMEAIFNPSFPYRLAHMLLAAYLTTAFVVGAVGAWHLLKDKSSQAARKMFSMAMWMALIVAPLQVFVGDLHGLNTQEHQPAKVAAMEGHFKSEAKAPLYLFGWPNEEEAKVDYAIEIPGLASFILKHDVNATVTGLDAFPRDEWPPVPIVFWSFRIMVGIGLLMVFIGLWSGYLRLRKQLYDRPLLHRAAVLMGPLGFVAVIAGWVVTEVGRQPWVIHGLLRTSDAASPIDAVGVGSSLVAFIVVYFLVFGAGTVYMLRKMAGNPESTHIPNYARVPMAAERLYHEEG